VGETQIIGQVARSYSAAQVAGTAGPALSLLFESAIRASRKTRARSASGLRASSASSIAVQRAEDLAGALPRARVLLIGTGEMGRLVLRALRERRAGRIDVVTRTEDRAAALSERWGIKVMTPACLPDLLEACDVVISSTSSSVPLVTEALVRAALKQRGERPLALIDLAVPRTIEKRAGLVPGVTLLDIDSLKDPARESAAAEDPVIAAIIKEELEVLELRMAEMAFRPVIGSMWRRADGIRNEVLTRTRARMPELDDRAWVHIENLAHALVAKLLHDPATRLRAEAGNGHAREHAEALRHLFGLSELPGRPPQ
jgi:glutamyl-tRNA reductase